MKILEKIVTGAAILAMVGCAAPKLLEGESINKIDINLPTGEVNYRMTNEAEMRLGVVTGIREGSIFVYKGYDDSVRAEGLLGSTLSPTFQEAYQEADTDGNGAVDTPEARALYDKAIEEALQE